MTLCDVRVATTLEGYRRLQGLVGRLSAESGIVNRLLGTMVIPAFFVVRDDSVSFGWNAVEWCDGAPDDVACIRAALEMLAEAGVPMEVCQRTCFNDTEGLALHLLPEAAKEGDES